MEIEGKEEGEKGEEGGLAGAPPCLFPLLVLVHWYSQPFEQWKRNGKEAKFAQDAVPSTRVKEFD